MKNFTGGFQNDAQRQRFAAQQMCSPQAENPGQQDGGKRLAEPLRGTKKQLIGTIAGVGVVILLLVLKALNVF